MADFKSGDFKANDFSTGSSLTPGINCYGVFNARVFNNSIFNTCVIPITTGDTHDGGWSDRDYKRYRRKLEILSKAGDRFNESKYVKEANKVLGIIQEIPVSAPFIERIATKEIELNPAYFYAIQQEIALALEYLNMAINRKEYLRIEAAQELEDEQIIMMLI